MNIAPYTKSILAVVGGITTVTTEAVTLSKLLPSDYSAVVMAVTLLSALGSGGTAFAVWLAKNESLIQSDVDAVEQVVTDVKTVADHVSVQGVKDEFSKIVHSPLAVLADAELIGQEIAAVPAAVRQVVAEAKTDPVQAVSDAITAVSTATQVAAVTLAPAAAATVTPSVADILNANPIR